MSNQQLTFPVFEKSWGDEWYEDGVKRTENNGEFFPDICDAVFEDEQLARLYGLAIELNEAQEVGLPELIDCGRYLVIPLDHDRDLARQAHQEVNG